MESSSFLWHHLADLGHNHLATLAVSTIHSRLSCYDANWRKYAESRRGFTIRLKRHNPRAPYFGGGVLGVKTIFSIFVSNYICIFVLVHSTHVFYVPLTTDLYTRTCAKDSNEWRWTFSFHGVDNWLLLRVIVDQNSWIHFFRLHEASEVLYQYVMGVCSDNFTAAFVVTLVSLWLFLLVISKEFWVT